MRLRESRTGVLAKLRLGRILARGGPRTYSLWLVCAILAAAMMSAGRETAAEKQATVTPAKSVTVAEKVGEVKTEAGTVKTITVDCSGADPEPEYHMDMIGVLTAESIDVNAPTVQVGQTITVQIVKVEKGKRTPLDGITWSVPGSTPVSRGNAGDFWSTSGDYEKSFNPNNNNDNQITDYDNEPNDPLKNDYKKADFTLHWVNRGGGGGAIVRADFAADKMPLTRTATFTVLAPMPLNVNLAFYKGGQSKNGVTNNLVAGSNGLAIMQFGDYPAKKYGATWVGLNFNYRRPNQEIPNNMREWRYCSAQVVKSSHIEVIVPRNTPAPFDKPGTWGVPPGKATKGLDGAFPYFGKDRGISAVNATIWSGDDSPKVTLVSGGTSSYDGAFETWYMVQPVKSKDESKDGKVEELGDWTPAAEIEWAVRMSDKWPAGANAPAVPDPAQPTASATPIPPKNVVYPFAPTRRFPQWGAVVLPTTLELLKPPPPP